MPYSTCCNRTFKTIMSFCLCQQYCRVKFLICNRRLPVHIVSILFSIDHFWDAPTQILLLIYQKAKVLCSIFYSIPPSFVHIFVSQNTLLSLSLLMNSQCGTFTKIAFAIIITYNILLMHVDTTDSWYRSVMAQKRQKESFSMQNLATRASWKEKKWSGFCLAWILVHQRK